MTDFAVRDQPREAERAHRSVLGDIVRRRRERDAEMEQQRERDAQLGPRAARHEQQQPDAELADDGEERAGVDGRRPVLNS